MTKWGSCRGDLFSYLETNANNHRIQNPVMVQNLRVAACCNFTNNLMTDWEHKIRGYGDGLLKSKSGCAWMEVYRCSKWHLS